MPTYIEITRKPKCVTIDFDIRSNDGFIRDKPASKVTVFHNADRSITIDIERVKKEEPTMTVRREVEP